MTQLSHNFEPGTPGSTLIAGAGQNTDTAGNNFFDDCFITAGDLNQYTADSYQGTSAVEIGARGTAGTVRCRWQASLGSPGIDTYHRFFFKTTDIPTVAGDFFFLDTSAGGRLSDIGLNTAGKLTVRTALSLITGTTVLSTNTWYRIEVKLHADTAVGYATLRLYADPTAPIASFTEEINPNGTTTWTMPTAVVNRIEIQGSSVANWPSATGFVRYDGLIVANESNWIGPIQTQLPLPSWPRIRFNG